jgi:hypothetical protein
MTVLIRREVTCAFQDRIQAETTYLFSCGTFFRIRKGDIFKSNNRFKVRNGEWSRVGVEVGWSLALLILGHDHKLSLARRRFFLIWTV